MQSQWNAAKALVCYPIVRQRAKIWYQKTTSKPNFRNWLHRNHFCPSALACVCVALAVDKPCLDLRNHILVQLVWHFHAGLQKHSFQLVSLSIMYTAMQRQSAPSSTPSSWHTRTISCSWNWEPSSADPIHCNLMQMKAHIGQAWSVARLRVTCMAIGCCARCSHTCCWGCLDGLWSANPRTSWFLD